MASISTDELNILNDDSVPEVQVEPETSETPTKVEEKVEEISFDSFIREENHSFSAEDYDFVLLEEITKLTEADELVERYGFHPGTALDNDVSAGCETKTNTSRSASNIDYSPRSGSSTSPAAKRPNVESAHSDANVVQENMARAFQEDEDKKSAQKLEDEDMRSEYERSYYCTAPPGKIDRYHLYLDLCSDKPGRFDIFLSYRRMQKGFAGRLKGSLESRGFKVFMDINAAAKDFIGADPFQSKLMNVVAQCKVMLVLITPGPSCSDIDDPRYKLTSLETMLENRKNGKQDWVYDEIVAALEQGKTCIPVISGDEGKTWR